MGLFKKIGEMFGGSNSQDARVERVKSQDPLVEDWHEKTPSKQAEEERRAEARTAETKRGKIANEEAVDALNASVLEAAHEQLKASVAAEESASEQEAAEQAEEAKRLAG